MRTRNLFSSAMGLLSCLLALTTIGEAWASVGIVVRLVVESGEIEGDVSVTMTNAASRSFEIPLQDNGKQPDVFADDQRYSGTAMIEGVAFEVSTTIGTETLEVGSVSWPEDDKARDLVVTKGAGILTLETSSGGRGEGEGTPAPFPGATDAALADANARGMSPGDGSSNPPGRTPNVSFPTGATAKGDSTLYIIAGIIVLVLAIVAFMWFRGSGTPEPRLISRRQFDPLREPGLLGGPTPSLSDGLSIWVVDNADVEDFFELLLTSMAQHHRVLVVTGTRNEIPPVFGGPIYRTKSSRPIHVADTIDGLAAQIGNPLAVLVHAGDTSSDVLNDYADLIAPEIGTILLTPQHLDATEPTVEVSRTGSGWRLDCAAGSVQLTKSEWGIRVEGAAPPPRTETPSSS